MCRVELVRKRQVEAVRLYAPQLEARMCKQLRALGNAAILGAGPVMVTPLAAQQPPASPAAGTPTETPTKKDPLRFTAFNVSMPTGVAGVTQIAIERWSTVAERTKLLEFAKQRGTAKAASASCSTPWSRFKLRVGFIRTPNSIGWDLRYAVENTLQDGTRQLVICTDKPVSFAAAASNSRTMDYPFTLIEMRFSKPGEKGEGKMLAATSIMAKNGRLELENYGQEPVRLTEITEQERKKKS